MKHTSPDMPNCPPALKCFLRGTDIIYEPPDHDHSSSVFGGVLTLLFIVFAVGYGVWRGVSYGGTTVISEVARPASGELFVGPVLRVNVKEGLNVSYVFPTDSACLALIAESAAGAELLAGSGGSSGLPHEFVWLPFNTTFQEPLCDDSGALRGTASALANFNGLLLSAFHDKFDNDPYLVTIVNGDGSETGIPNSREAQRDRITTTLREVEGAPGLATWGIPDNASPGLLSPWCVDMLPYPPSFSCSQLVLNTARAVRVITTTEILQPLTDYVFATAEFAVAIYGVLACSKLFFRKRVKPFVRGGWRTCCACQGPPGGPEATEGGDLEMGGDLGEGRH